MVANCARNCVKYKARLGKHAYSLQTVVELIKAREEKFDISINDGEFTVWDLEVQFMLLYNGKFGGGRMLLNPMAIINDGHFEFYYLKNFIGFTPAIKLFGGAKKGGLHIYNNDF